MIIQRQTTRGEERSMEQVAIMVVGRKGCLERVVALVKGWLIFYSSRTYLGTHHTFGQWHRPSILTLSTKTYSLLLLTSLVDTLTPSVSKQSHNTSEHLPSNPRSLNSTLATLIPNPDHSLAHCPSCLASQSEILETRVSRGLRSMS